MHRGHGAADRGLDRHRDGAGHPVRDLPERIRRHGAFIRAVRLAIANLAGVPSIVFGLFGFALFVFFFRWKSPLLAGCCTLAAMALPVIITACEESLRAVPEGLREGPGPRRDEVRQATRTNVLPHALPGMLTSSILGIARVAGETAPSCSPPAS